MVNQSHSIYTWISRLPRWLVIALAVPLVVLDGWVILLVLNYFRSIVSALVIATALAFLLGFPVQFLQNRGMQRPQAVFLVFLLALTGVATLAVTLVPVVIIQLQDLLVHLPDLLNSGSRQLEIFQSWAVIRRLPVNVSGLITRLEQLAPEGLETFSLQIPGVVLGAADSLLETIVVVALTLYLMLHGESFWRGLFRWFPQPLSEQIQQSLQQNFQNYFIGQATVALIQGVLLSLAFLILQLPMFLIFGMGIGLLALIPFFDILGVLLVSLITALSNIWLGLGVLALCLVIDQIVDNAISPRIMGKLVGLNPIWIILSLLLGVQIGGFVGIVLAIPLASTVQDIVNYFYPLATDPNAAPETPIMETQLISATEG